MAANKLCSLENQLGYPQYGNAEPVGGAHSVVLKRSINMMK